MKQIKFPADEQKHDYIIEWWYFNGHLKGKNGKNYSFMDCFFRADVKRVKIPFLRVPLKNVHFSHSILSDVTKNKFYPEVDLFSVVSEDSFQRPLLYINYTDPIIIDGYVNRVIEEPCPFEYHIKTSTFDLDLRSTKPPLLEGGNGYLDLSGRKTYYYSLTNLEARGIVKDGKDLVKVEGKAWMDHQWANTPYAKDKWTWFSLQLKNETEIVCFEYGGEKKNYLASTVHPGGKADHTDEVMITPVGRAWTSKTTKAKYYLSWKIEIPSQKAEFYVEPLIKKQEMIFGSINYWEGPLSVKGTMRGKKVSGQGFLELVGRQAQYNSLNFFKDALKKRIKNLSLRKISFKRK